MYTRRIISVTGAVLSIGVCVFITWFSRDVDRTTIFFNLGFLALMLCMILAASLTGMRRLMQITRSLRRATGAIRDRQGASETTPLFENAFLDDCYQQFCSMRRNHPESACDIQNFLNEDAIENYVHRSVLEGVSDILTSLGILGTFVGLVMGLREFDPSGYEQMTGSVTPLINGIKVAFITSIYGIALSLSFSFNLRSEFSGLSFALDAFLDAFYQYVQPPYEVDSLSKLMAQQKDQEALVHDLTGIFVEQMAQSFEQSITPAFTKMTDSFSQVTETLLQSQEELLTNVCTTVARQMRHELESEFEQIHKLVTELGKSQSGYSDFMDRTMDRMERTLNAMTGSSKETQQHLADSMQELAIAQKEAAQISQDQQKAYQDYIRFMYQSLEQFSEIWKSNSEEMRQVSSEIAASGPIQSSRELQRQIAGLAGQLEQLQQRQVEMARHVSENYPQDVQQDMYDQLLRKMDELAELTERPLFFSRKKEKKSSTSESRRQRS